MKPRLKPVFYIAFFISTLTVLIYQMLLTRIFSVTMWYHFAFVAVSLAMLGMTAGAIFVHFYPDLFSEDSLFHQIARFSLLFSISIVVCLLLQLSIPFRFRGLVGLSSLAFTYFFSAIPFFLCGVIVCIVLTRFKESVSRLYALDLLGAGLGCVLFIPLLEILDAPTAIVAVAGIAGLGALLFSCQLENKKFIKRSMAWTMICIVFVSWHSVRAREGKPLLEILWVKGRPDPPRLYERWNAFSSVRVFDVPLDCKAIESHKKSYGSAHAPIKVLDMNIDAAGATPIHAFNGNFKKVEALKNHLINIVHYLRPESKVLIIGPGGGIDVLSSLIFKQKKIVAVEINKAIIETLNNRFGDFSGHLDKYPNVLFLHQEGRSYAERTQEKFDIILFNVVDTWAAGAAGAYTLSENTLYTLEAWATFLNRLSPRGIMAFARYYKVGFPDEMYRLTSLGVSALKRIGIYNPREHLLAYTSHIEPGDAWVSGCLLVSKEPFSAKDIKTVEELFKTKNFQTHLSPHYASDNNFEMIASGKDLERFFEQFPSDITAPTDDRPFFFHRLRISDFILSLFRREAIQHTDVNWMGVAVLVALLIIVLLLVSATIIFPLLSKYRTFDFSNHYKMLVYFAAIGMGFMMIEISQLQRLSIFMGHPSYSLSVVLFSLLMGSGLGSFISGKFIRNASPSFYAVPFSLLILALLIFGFLTPLLMQHFSSSQIPVKIMVSCIILIPLGITMGMPFPIGMSAVSQKTNAPAAYFWGINGATSVCASVLAVAVALSWGISVSFWTGSVFYTVAVIAFSLEQTATHRHSS